MTRIRSIHVHVNTGNLSGAGTDGDVYLGIAGREFYVDSTADDFERGSARTYIFGEGANVINPPPNDPREHVLHIESVDRFPVYLRFQPRSRSDNWHIQRAQVSFNDAFFPRWDSAAIVPIRSGIWLGVRSGLVLHIPRHNDGVPGVAAAMAVENEVPS
jgi:hypothetical protein